LAALTRRVVGFFFWVTVGAFGAGWLAPPASLPAARQPCKNVRMPHYREPGWFTKNVFNRVVALATRLGISVWGSRVLRVKGRKSGQWRSTPVNLLTIEGTQYLVAPRGETQWVKNLRVAREGELVLGRRAQSFSAEEIPDSDKVEILRAYLRRWKAEVGVFFSGVSADSPVDDLQRIAPEHPVFRIKTAA
jgi:deazaflavin-dependent oxidoreductase (nitroreductase family)